MNPESNLPKPIKNYLKSVNRADPETFLQCFAPEAVVQDVGREFRGTVAIKAWSDHEIFAVQVSLELIKVSARDDQFTLLVKVDGNFDKTGLPDPLLLTNRFTLTDNRITALTCALATEL